MEPGLFDLLVLPMGLGLLGFVEPCSIGASLLFLGYVEGRDTSTKIAQTVVFTLTRAIFIGALGVLAALVGDAFVGFQKAGWALLGAVYVGLGLVYLVGRSGAVKHTLGPSLGRLTGIKGAVALAALFGLNIPACAAPLLFAILGAVAVGAGAALEPLVTAFVSLGVFGLALSLPLALAIMWAPARRALERISAYSHRVPMAIGFVLVGLGLWSVYFGLFVTPRP
ncbi:MAG: cytochrome c biogenesis protein CcdA [Alphaproteobacteria bacterium]